MQMRKWIHLHFNKIFVITFLLFWLKYFVAAEHFWPQHSLFCPALCSRCNREESEPCLWPQWPPPVHLWWQLWSQTHLGSPGAGSRLDNIFDFYQEWPCRAAAPARTSGSPRAARRSRCRDRIASPCPCVHGWIFFQEILIMLFQPFSKTLYFWLPPPPYFLESVTKNQILDPFLSTFRKNHFSHLKSPKKYNKSAKK